MYCLLKLLNRYIYKNKLMPQFDFQSKPRDTYEIRI